MYTLVELWTPKPSWLAASRAEREAFMNGVGQAMGQLTAMGVEVLSWNTNDADTSHRADASYFAVWRFPSLDVAQGFEAAVQASGWYDYFEHTNVRGLDRTPPDVIGEHIGLPAG
jgi:hypothetical protein